ncbi:MAG: PKD domain-containing protein [Bacteroidota bacterium]|nr:PKD domain-containing protein [Bacteroidota bacterium]
MKFFYRFLIMFFASAVLYLPVFTQTNTYILNGSAQQNSCNCYTLTPAVNFRNGSVWNANKIDLTLPFDFSFNVFLGCVDVNGADGIVFMLQPLSTSLGGFGGGMGFEGVSPSVGISLDTWQNIIYNDPAYDHISIQVNGNSTHGTDLAGPVRASATSDNIEDCQWHVFRISWDPSTKKLRAYFDGSLRVETQVDIIASIFNHDPMVYWGFSAATGGANNEQKFCTALIPDFKTNLTGNGACLGNTIDFQDQSASFSTIADFYWNFGDGNTSTVQNPSHLYSLPGIYEVKLVITAKDGCVSDTLRKNVAIGDKPISNFDVFDTCYHKIPRINDYSTVVVGNINQWSWTLDGNPVSDAQQPQLSNISAGPHQLQLVVTSNYGCSSQVASKNFVLKPLPVIDAVINDGCVNTPLSFTGQQLDNITTITEWNWQFGDGQSSLQQNPLHTFNKNGNFDIKLSALDNNGCGSDTMVQSVFINKAKAFAGNDTIIVKDQPFQLRGAGGVSYSWSPVTGLSNPFISDPITILQDDITYTLTATTIEGCTDTDEINITVFKGSAIYVPTGFTPNGDGLNDKLKPGYFGIKKLEYFTIYNRWGELVFTTKDIGEGWDGTYKGTTFSTGTFVWILQAEDYIGKLYQLKGTFTLIR